MTRSRSAPAAAAAAAAPAAPAVIDPCDPKRMVFDSIDLIAYEIITNPAARTDKSSPIFGMPILDVDRAQHVFVVKRSMNPGYAGIENLLYYMDNCSLVFGDAKAVCEALVNELRAG